MHSQFSYFSFSLPFTEVLIKVQVFDNSDLSPLKEAAIQVYGNQSTLASGLAGEDGIVKVTFMYRPGTWVIVAASKHGFVTNSAPWHASRIPCEYSHLRKAVFYDTYHDTGVMIQCRHVQCSLHRTCSVG